MGVNSALALAFAILPLSSAAVLRGQALLGNGMQPEVVARTLSSVQDEWKAQADVFAECSGTSGLPGASIVNCADAPSSFGKSCTTVVGAIVQGSGGDKDVAKEYMEDVCSQKSMSGWHQTQCHSLALAVRGSMSADKYSNRLGFDSNKLCTGFWSGLLDDEKTRLTKEKAIKDAAEKKAAEEAAEQEKQEEEAKKKEAAAKAAEAAERLAQKKAEAKATQEAAERKMQEAKEAEQEQAAAKKAAAEKVKEAEVKVAEAAAEKAKEAEAKSAAVKAAPKPTAAVPAEVKAAPAKTEAAPTEVNAAVVEAKAKTVALPAKVKTPEAAVATPAAKPVKAEAAKPVETKH